MKPAPLLTGIETYTSPSYI